jgi:hypothetical protein
LIVGPGYDNARPTGGVSARFRGLKVLLRCRRAFSARVIRVCGRMLTRLFQAVVIRAPALLDVPVVRPLSVCCRSGEWGGGADAAEVE